MFLKYCSDNDFELKVNDNDMTVTIYGVKKSECTAWMEFICDKENPESYEPHIDKIEKSLKKINKEQE